MAAITNPGRYVITSFNANYGLSGGLLFALEASTGNYYAVSEFQKSNANSRRFPYEGKVEDTTYYFGPDGITSTAKFTLYCASGVSGSGSGSGSGGGGGNVPLASLSAKDKVALQVLNAMIGLTPNPLAYKNATTRLLVQKAFEISQEFALQANGGNGSGGGGSEDPGDRSYIPFYSLDDLAGVRKVYWCTQYPAEGEEGAAYIKIKTVDTNGGGA